MKYTKTINLDINKPFFEVLNAKQGDNSRYLLFNLLNNGVPFVLTGRTVRAYAVKPDNTKVYNDLAIVSAINGQVELQLTSQMLAVAGMITLELVIYEGTDLLSTTKIILAVISNLRSEDAIISTNEFSALTNALAAVDNLEVNYAPRLTSVESSLSEKANASYVETKFGNMGNTKTFKGSCLFSALPITGMLANDYWYVTDQTTNYCYNGTSWVDIGNNNSLGDGVVTVSKLDSDLKNKVYNFLYGIGNEYTEKTGGWGQGYKASTTVSNITKGADCINIPFTSIGATADNSIENTIAIDLTYVDTLYVDWEQTVGNIESTRANLTVCATAGIKRDGSTNTLVNGIFSRRVSTLDVSSLTGLYYISVHAGSNTSGDSSGNLNIYGIYTNTIELNSLNSKINALNHINLGSLVFANYGKPFAFTTNGMDCNITTIAGSETWINFDGLTNSSQGVYFGVKPNNTNPILGAGIFVDGVYTFNLLHNHMLIYNTATNTISDIYNNSAYVFKTTDKVLAYCHAGEIKGGAFFEIYNWYINKNNISDISTLRTDVNALINNTTLVSYVADEVALIKETLLSKQTQNTCSIGFLTDMHYSDLTITNILHAMQSLNEISKIAKIDFVCFGGDNVANVATKAEQLATMSSLKLLANKYIPVSYVPVKGNHDDNSIVCTTNGSAGYEVLDSEYYLRLFKENENKYNIVFDENNRDGLYCYMDLPTSKIRAIFLNSIDIPHIINGDGTLKYDGQHVYGYSNEQLNWVANKALNFSDKTDKSEWGVVVMQHISCVPVAGFYESVTNNGQVMFDIFKAFKGGTSYTSIPTTGDFTQSVIINFTSQGVGNLIAMISGHGHEDYDGVVDNILHITSLQVASNEYGNGVSKDGNTYVKVPGTANETGYDIFTIDKVNKKIFATRYGVGADREWSY